MRPLRQLEKTLANDLANVNQDLSIVKIKIYLNQRRKFICQKRGILVVENGCDDDNDDDDDDEHKKSKSRVILRLICANGRITIRFILNRHKMR